MDLLLQVSVLSPKKFYLENFGGFGFFFFPAEKIVLFKRLAKQSHLCAVNSLDMIKHDTQSTGPGGLSGDM